MNIIPLENVRQQAKNFLNSLPCHVQAPYPSPNIPTKNKNIADLLLSAYADGGNAEFTAVSQYMYHSLTIKNENVSTLIYCIALSEMYHLQLIGRMIDSLGGNPKYLRPNNYYWSGGNVSYGSNMCEKISIDIFSEQQAIAGYNNLLRIIRNEKTPGLKQVEDVINRIIEDEKFHLSLFTKYYEQYCDPQKNHPIFYP